MENKIKNAISYKTQRYEICRYILKRNNEIHYENEIHRYILKNTYQKLYTENHAVQNK